MAVEAKTLLFLESTEQVAKYLREPFAGPGSLAQVQAIAINPAVQASLKRRGQESCNSLPYMTQASRTRGWQKSAEITKWMREQFDFEDNWGVRLGYVENLVWFTRWLVNYLIWSIEIIDNAVTTHRPDGLIVFSPQSPDFSGPYGGGKELYFSTMAHRLASDRSIECNSTPIETHSSSAEKMRAAAHHLITRLAPNPAVRRSHHRQLSRLAERNPVLYTSQFYRLNVLADRMQRDQGIVPVLLTDWGVKRSLGWPMRMNAMPPFAAEAKANLLEPAADEDQHSRRNLEDSINDFTFALSREVELFSHLGIPFADIVAHKVRMGIEPVIMQLHRRSATLQMLLNILRPSLVIANGCRIDDIMIGELCQGNGIPSVMITHGSHVPPANDAERFEWGEHGRRLINAPYQFTALQSPLAEEFRSAFPSSAKGARTGPLIWAKSEPGEQNQNLRRSLVGDSDICKVVVHAGTPKGRMGMRFHVAETPDEYVQSISDLVEAVDAVPDTRLIVMFRPSEEISLDDLTTLLPYSEKTKISVTAPLVKVLGFADLLVSFSSTVIEEALLNKVPVLLYGGGGRYKHVAAAGPTDSSAPSSASGPVYHVSNSRDLPNALQDILHSHNVNEIDGANFAPYIYQPEQLTPISQLVSSIESVPTDT